ncbi:helix-turn-helix domain-containing protein [Salinisphaera aquimarina]|uniref:Helix-turn-helix transcriptional regulator n=1 Tax=Salinisphaera aquimarina TaxID=2094031 RepID=A0ABV7EME1_9GAMM
MTGKEIDPLFADAVRALGTARFAEALSALVRQLAAFDNLIVIAYSGEQRPEVLHREYTDPVVYLPMDSQYLGGDYLLDPFYQQHRQGEVRGIRRLADVAPDRFKRTNYFRNYYKQTTLLDEIAVFAPVNATVTITACFGKDRSSGSPFSQRELKALQRQQGTLSALVETHWRAYRPAQTPQIQTVPLSDRLRDTLEKERGVHLSPRQAEVALYILRGHSTLSIGLYLDISPQTVKVFRRQLYAKCGISSQAQLFAMMMPLFSRLTDKSAAGS